MGLKSLPWRARMHISHGCPLPGEQSFYLCSVLLKRYSLSVLYFCPFASDATMTPAGQEGCCGILVMYTLSSGHLPMVEEWCLWLCYLFLVPGRAGISQHWALIGPAPAPCSTEQGTSPPALQWLAVLGLIGLLDITLTRHRWHSNFMTMIHGWLANFTAMKTWLHR